MKKVIFLVLITICTTAVAQNSGVEYDQVEVLTKDWQLPNVPFCFKTEHQVEQRCLTTSDMGEIKLRDSGANSSSAGDVKYFAALSEDAKQLVSQYYKFYVRYLALDAQRFMVHVFFLQNKTPEGQIDLTQTLYAFGTYQRTADGQTQTQLDTMSFSNGLEYFGGILIAAAELGRTANKISNDDLPKLEALIVKRNLPLVRVGEEVARNYLSTLAPAAQPGRP